MQAVYDLMRVVGVESYTPRTPLERILRDALVFPSTTAATWASAAANSMTSSAFPATTRCSPPRAAPSPAD